MPLNMRELAKLTESYIDSDGTIAASSVDSSAITDGAIVNADVNASAAIAYSKLNLAAAVAPSDAKVETTNVSLPVVIRYAVTADASSGLAIFDAACPFKLRICDVTVECTTAETNGTLKLTDGTNDITDAIACAADTAVDRAATIDDSKAELAAGATLKVVAAGDTAANTRGIVTILAVKTS